MLIAFLLGMLVLSILQAFLLMLSGTSFKSFTALIQSLIISLAVIIASLGKILS